MNDLDRHEPGREFWMPIERGKIREFARATKCGADAYMEVEHPVVPPTFLMTASFWQSREHVAPGHPTDFHRLLHGSQEFVFHPPMIRAGESLRVRQRVARTWQKQGRRGGEMTFHDVVTEFRDEAGELRAEAISTLIETGRTPEREPR